MSEHVPKTSTPSPLENNKLLGIGLGFGLLVTLICIVIITRYDSNNTIPKNIKALADAGFTINSVTVLIVLTFLYLYAYTLYKKNLFFFIALFWLHNLFYMLYSAEWKTNETYEYSALLFLLSFTADVYLFVAAKVYKNSKSELKNLIIPGLILALWLIFQIPTLPLSDEDKKYIFFFIGPLFSCYILFITGRLIFRNFEKNIFSTILGYTFIFYAFMQLFFLVNSIVNYVFQFSVEFKDTVITAARAVSLGLKTINGVVLLILLRNDFAKLISAKQTADMDLKYTIERIQAQRKEIELKTELLEKERELNEQILLQKSEFEDLGILTASIEHELRNPLGVINNLLVLMRNEYQSDEKLLKYLDDLEKEGRSMLAATDIVNTLRSTQEDLIDKMKEIDVEAFINRIIRNVKKEFGDKANQIFFKVNKQKEELFIKGFPFLLEKVFINFAKNAIESILTKSDKGVITFDLTVETKDKVTISVSDNGTGFVDLNGEKIFESELYKIVEASYTTKSAKDSKANRGIGLFVCDRIVKIHKGKMKFENLKDGGAKISVTLERYFSKKMRKKEKLELPENHLLN